MAKMLLVVGMMWFWSFGFPAYSNTADVSLLSDSALQPTTLIDVAMRHHHVIIIELATGKLHVYRRNDEDIFTLLEVMDVSIGKEGYGKHIEGDNKTPVGIYRITSYLTPKQLDDFYGHAAYPVNYPNVWDKLNKRTGFGIWLHAEPMGFTTKTRPLLDSNGCVVLSNNDIDNIHQYIDVGYTYIIMTPIIEMMPVNKLRQQRKTLRQRIDAWQLAWESLHSNAYLSFYSKQFFNLEKDWNAWVRYKKRINRFKKFIDVDTSDMSIYAYPGEKDMVWVEFYQSYSSSNFQSTGWKRQLWKLEQDNVWRIIYEGGG